MRHQLVCISETNKDNGILTLFTQLANLLQHFLTGREDHLNISISITGGSLVHSFTQHFILKVSWSTFLEIASLDRSHLLETIVSDIIHKVYRTANHQTSLADFIFYIDICAIKKNVAELIAGISDNLELLQLL